MNLPQYSGSLSAMNKEYPILGRAFTVHEATRQGRPMSFKDKPFLVELYADGRVDPLLKRIPTYIRRAVGGAIGSDDRSRGGKGRENAAGNRTLKQFGDGSLLFLGSGTDNDFVEFSADMMVVDEYDRCKSANIAMAVDRLRESPYPQQIHISNPTLPNEGICRLYNASDMRRWNHLCDRCGERQPLDWFEHVVTRDDSGRWVLRDTRRGINGEVRPMCRRCHKPFSRAGSRLPYEPIRRAFRRTFGVVCRVGKSARIARAYDGFL